MPRKDRIDATGALHHIIVRGIERRKIFYDDSDRDNFLERLGGVLTETGTPCFAWTLIPNHLHLLLRTRFTPIATVMKSAEGGLTGYAVSFNRRHRRHGQPSRGGSSTISKSIPRLNGCLPNIAVCTMSSPTVSSRPFN